MHTLKIYEKVYSYQQNTEATFIQHLDDCKINIAVVTNKS